MRPENPSDRNFFRPLLRLCDPCTRTNFSSSKILAHCVENEHFPPPIPRPLLSADLVIGHGRGRGLGPRSNFALPRVVQSINVHYSPHPLSELSPCSIVPINQWHSEVPRREINNGHDLNILRGFPQVLTSEHDCERCNVIKGEETRRNRRRIESKKTKGRQRFKFSSPLEILVSTDGKPCTLYKFVRL